MEYLVAGIAITAGVALLFGAVALTVWLMDEVNGWAALAVALLTGVLLFSGLAWLIVESEEDCADKGGRLDYNAATKTSTCVIITVEEGPR